MINKAQSSQYNEKFAAALQWMWGDGYLAPGGPAEVAELLGSVDIRDKRVLDIGCGLGAIAVLLVDQYGAGSVHGIDVETHLIEHCRRRAKKAARGDRISFELVKPGPLKFEDESFDVVFTKDVIVHVPDKPTFYQDIFRLLKPGGIFVGSDWLRGGKGACSTLAAKWLEYVHLDFQMKNLEQTRSAIEAVGFDHVRMNDRNRWYCEEVKKEIAALEGDKFGELARMIGRDEADYRLESSLLKQQVINEGFLRPTHFVGYKPSQ